MVRIGITGGIGSGKSTVCSVWEAMGAEVLNADRLAKELMQSDEIIKKELTKAFGTNVYADDGRLNREYLAEEAFANNRVEELNAIVHPRMPKAVEERMEKAEQQGIELFVYEAALLIENLRPDFLDALVMVLADRDQRIERVLERDNSTANEIQQRIQKQRNFEDSVHLADHVIRNNGSLQDLKKKAKKLYQNLLS